MRTLSREAPPGEKWLYKTGETNLIGVLVSAAINRPLSDYLSENLGTLWHGAGRELVIEQHGQEISGCCIQATTRDFARYGLFMLNGALIDGKPILPEGWIAQATTAQVESVRPGKGYGYQWWTDDDGSFAAQGIFGQGISLSIQSVNW